LLCLWEVWLSQPKPPRPETKPTTQTFISSPEFSILGKRPPESDIGQPGSIPTIPPAVSVVEGPALNRLLVDNVPTDDGLQTDDTVMTDSVDADTCPFARVVHVVQPFLTEIQTELPSMMMIPSPIMDGSASHIMVTVRSSEFSVILDNGAEMSVLPLTQVKKFQPPVQLPATVHEVRTFGPSTATLFGPVPLDISLCGVQICHPFYFVDATLPPNVGYDLMKAARLVVDVDNHLVWSRRLQASVPSSPNPPVSVPNPTVNACVSFVRPEPSAPPAEESSPSSSVVEVLLSVSVSSSVESTSMSSVVSCQVSIVVPPLRCCASTLNPNASPFRPCATSLPSDAHRPHADSSTQHRYLPVYPW